MHNASVDIRTTRYNETTQATVFENTKYDLCYIQDADFHASWFKASNMLATTITERTSDISMLRLPY